MCIRDRVKTSDFGSAFHEALEMKADCDLSVISGPYEARQTTVVPAGETLMTVSYTHLDVYKRQLLASVFIISLLGAFIMMSLTKLVGRLL